MPHKIKLWVGILAVLCTASYYFLDTGIIWKKGIGAWYEVLFQSKPSASLADVANEAARENGGQKLQPERSVENKKQYKPGWLVQLHTASFPDGRMTLDPGIVRAYIEAGPVFAQETFVKQFLGASTGLQQNIAAVASSQFHVQTEGAYQFGVQIEVPSNIICHATLALPENDKALSELKGLKVPGVGKWSGASLVKLSVGYHDTKLTFGCEGWYMDYIFKKSAPALKGNMTIRVMHPDDLAPSAARQDDFVHTVTDGVETTSRLQSR